MKVYQDCPPELGLGIKRVVAAIERYAPTDVQFVSWAHEADLVIHHVVGVANFGATPIDKVIADQCRPYAIVQYCFRTTEQPTASWWQPLWRHARAVWSYYDLDRACFDEFGGTFPRFYYAPLGGDASVFMPPPEGLGVFTVGCSGYVAETEGVHECVAAAESIGGAVLHLGPELHLGSRVMHVRGIDDQTLARLWGECDYVAGLRRVEGFELPAVEGLLCGARPVCFDAPHYRQWFGDLADYVPEGSPEVVTAALRKLMRQPRHVSEFEICEARRRFDWQRLVGGFWEMING